MPLVCLVAVKSADLVSVLHELQQRCILWVAKGVELSLHVKGGPK